MKEYELKKDPLNENRIKKIVKNIIDNGTEDRQTALDTFNYFKEIVEENPQDSDAKKGMVDCLKLSQSAKILTIKLLDLVYKHNNLKLSKKGEKALPSGSDFNALLQEIE